MRKLFILVAILLSLSLSTVGLSTTTYFKNSTTGGTSTSLDGVDGDDLSDGDRAFVKGHTYSLDADSGASENDPYVISPDTNAGTKRWLLDVIMSRSVEEYYIDPNETDQGITGNGYTIKARVDTIGTSKKATIKLLNTGAGNTTSYTLTTSETIPDNITLEVENGAILTGAGTLTMEGQFVAGLYQTFGSSITVSFSIGSIIEVYPEWWGIDGTADDVQINAANDALPSVGGIVKLQDRIYSTSAYIELDTGTTLLGISSKSTKIVPASTMTNIIQTATSATDVEVRNIWIYGTGDTGVTERGFYSDSGTDILIKNCRIENMTYAVQLQTVTRATVTENLIINTAGVDGANEGYGVLANTDGDHISVINNKFKSLNRHAIYFSSGTSNSQAIGNLIEDVEEGAISVYATAAQNTCKNINIIDNIIKNVTSISTNGHGIDIDYNSYNVQLIGNIIDNPNDYGIFLQSGTTETDTSKILNRVLVSNNTIEDGTQGIRVANGLDIMIIGNNIYSPSGNAIHITHSGSAAATITHRVIIEGNTIRDAGGDGIVIEGSTYLQDITLGANNISNTTGTDIVESAGMVNFKNLSGPVWHEEIVTYSDFAAVSTTPTHDLSFTIPVGSVITGLWWNLDTEFSGGIVSAATLQLGLTGDVTDGFFPAENVFTGAGTGLKDSAITNWGSYLYDSANKQSLQYFCTADKTLTLLLTLTDDTGDNLTAGQVRVWIRYEQVKVPTT